MNSKTEFEVEQFIRRIGKKNDKYHFELEQQIENWYRAKNTRYMHSANYSADRFFMAQKQKRDELHLKQHIEYLELKKLGQFSNWRELIINEEKTLALRHERERQTLYKELDKDCKQNNKEQFSYNFRYKPQYQYSEDYIFSAYSPKADTLLQFGGKSLAVILLIFMIYRSPIHTSGAIFFLLSLKYLPIVLLTWYLYSKLRYARVSVSMEYEYIKFIWISKMSLYKRKPVRFAWNEIEKFEFKDLEGTCQKLTLFLKNKKKFVLHYDNVKKKEDFSEFKMDFCYHRPEPGKHLTEVKKK